MTGVTSGAGTTYPSIAPEFILGFVGFVLLDLLLSVQVVCRSLFVLFLLAIVLSVLRFTDSDYPFGILKLFLICTQISNRYVFLTVNSSATERINYDTQNAKLCNN
jgi:hypothetical protein